VGQVIAHAANLAPGDDGLGGQQVGGQRLDRFERIASIAAWMSASRCRSR